MRSNTSIACRRRVHTRAWTLVVTLDGSVDRARMAAAMASIDGELDAGPARIVLDVRGLGELRSPSGLLAFCLYCQGRAAQRCPVVVLGDHHALSVLIELARVSARIRLRRSTQSPLAAALRPAG